MKQRIIDWYYSFPIQLVATHLKNNLFLLSIWVLSTMFALGGVGSGNGWNYLFLTPEYLGRVDFFSFAILGLCFSGFLVTWNITTYILYSPRFPFLASLRRPFTKYFMNNSIVPLGFVVPFVSKLVDHQWYEECWGAGMIFYNVSGFFFGMLSALILTVSYFHFTNKDILSYVKPWDRMRPPNLDEPLLPGSRTATLTAVKTPDFIRVRSYLTESFRWRPVRVVSHYEEKYLLKVFRQNHANAIVIQTVSILSLMYLGYMIENPYFLIPAGGSYFILMAIVASIAGVLSYWLGRWTVMFAILLVSAVNALTRNEFIDPKNKAFGIVYDGVEVPYVYEKMQEIHSAENIARDKAETLSILERWKAKCPKSQLRKKPKMVIICTSGGGLRASLWTMQVLQQADEATKGRLMNQTTLITGASGGMISAAYFRELLLRRRRGGDIDLYDEKYLRNTGKDLLNAVIFTMVANDIFIPWERFEDNGQRYPKDRGYIFEHEINKHFEGVLHKRLGDYRQPELHAEIPMMFFTPSVVNDGRKLVISPVGVSYMGRPPHGNALREIGSDGLDFRKLMEGAQPDSLWFTTAIRANASFPYVLPNVSLPTEPRIELADAGFMDNMGLNSAHRFAQVFRGWIRDNTSGLVFVVIRGTSEQGEPISGRQGFVEAMVNPIRIMRRIVDIQDFEQDNLLSHAIDVFGEDFVHFIPFTYTEQDPGARASMNLHLTDREKIDVTNSFYNRQNQESLRLLKDVLR